MMPSGPKMTFYTTKIAFLEVKMWILANTPFKINFYALKPKNELFLCKNTTFVQDELEILIFFRVLGLWKRNF